MMSERLGKIGFWTIFLGFQLAFFPMHFAGLMGMPRRVYTYPAGMGLELPNMLSSIGVGGGRGRGADVRRQHGWSSLRAGVAAGPDPWDAPSLEWATTSPPPRL